MLMLVEQVATVLSRYCDSSVFNGIQIVDIATGESLGPNERGEICLQSPSITPGYMDNPEATAALIDKDGWMHTGTDYIHFLYDSILQQQDRGIECIRLLNIAVYQSISIDSLSIDIRSDGKLQLE